MKTARPRFRFIAALALGPWTIAPLAVAAPAEDPSATSASPDSDEDEAARLRKQAEQRYFEDDFQGAIDDFGRAHALAPHATDLFNMGRIYEEKGELAEAVRYYEQFVAQPKIPLEERALVAQRLEVLRPLVAPRDVEPSPPAPRAERDAPHRSTPAVDDPRAKSIRPLLISSSTLLGLGSAIALAGGLGFGLAARRASDRVERLGDGSNPERLGLAQAEDLNARGRDLETLQIASIAAGATLGVVGAALLVTALVRRRTQHRRAEHIATRMAPTPNGWRF